MPAALPTCPDVRAKTRFAAATSMHAVPALGAVDDPVAAVALARSSPARSRRCRGWAR